MPIYQVDPNGVDKAWTTGTVLISGGSASEDVALSDASDATYVRKKSGVATAVILDMPLETPAAGAGERIVAVVPNVRYRIPNEDFLALEMMLSYSYLDYRAKTPTYRIVRGPRAQLFGAVATASDSDTHPSIIALTSLTNAHLDDLMLSLVDYHEFTDSGRAFIYEAWASVYALSPATATVTGPASPVTDTSYPVITVDVSGVVELWQTNAPGLGDYLTAGDVEIKIFTAEQVADPDFDPEVVTPVFNGQTRYNNSVYGDGSTPSVVEISMQCATGLEHGVTYHTYARASRDVPGGIEVLWGAWDSDTFTTNLQRCSPPTLTVTAYDDYGLVDVSVTGVNLSAGHTDPLIEVQRDSGSGWETVRGFDGVPPAVAGGSILALPDYEAPRGVDVSYRARFTTALGSDRVATVWATDSDVELAASDWWFKVPQEPALTVAHVREVGDVPMQLVEDVGVFYPKGRSKPVVVAGQVHGYDGTYRIVADADEIADIQAVLAYAGSIYVEDPWGGAKWIRIVERSLTRRGAAAREEWSVRYLEVDPAPDI